MMLLLDNFVWFREDPETSGGKKDEPTAIRKIDIGKEAAIEAEVKAARERAIIPLEIRMKQFRDMLAEKEVRTDIPYHLLNANEA